MTLVPTPIRDTGFSYVLVSTDILRTAKPDVAAPVTDASHVVVIGEDGRLAQNGLLGELDRNPWGVRFRMGHLSILPFDAKEEFPGREVRVISEVGDRFDFDAWMRTQVEIPAGIDVTFERERYGRNGSAVVARTVKKGKVANIRVAIQPGQPILEQVAEIMERMRRTAPAPVVDLFDEPLPDYTCGAHVAALVRTLDHVGHRRVAKWLAADLEARENARPGTLYQGSQIAIPGAFLLDAKVEKLKLETTRKSNAVHAEIKLRGDHGIEDDETGSTVKLNAQLPETIVAAMRKRTMGQIVDVAWAAPLTIRTVPASADGTITFRAFSDNVPFALADPLDVGDEEIERRLRRAFADGRKGPDDTRLPVWTEVDTAVVPLLQGMGRHDLSVVVAELELYTQVDLARHGFEGWILRSQGLRIIAEKQPPVPVERLGLLRDEEGRKAA